jgi:hypothetical protein
MKLTLVIEPSGKVRTVYSDHLKGLDLGRQQVTRASLVEWNEERQEWVAYRVTTVNGDLQRGDVIAHGPNRREVEAREAEALMEEL